jgi:hypothetical protein
MNSAGFNIAGFNFRQLKAPTLFSGPGVYIYMHQASGKCFVRAVRNSRTQRGPNNYPKQLKDLLKVNRSEILIFLAELKKDTKEVLFLASSAVRTNLSERGMLYKNTKPGAGGAYRLLPGEGKELYTVWVMTHARTGALYYFEEIQGVDVVQKVSQRMLSFNNYVLKHIPNENRTMYNFAKDHFPLDISKWVIRDLELAFLSEQDATKYITRLSKQHLEANEVVLSRISNMDALYYRNSILKLSHVSMEQYLKFEEEEEELF